MSAQKHDANRDFIGFAEYPSFAEILSSERLISVMYDSMCKFGGERENGEKMAFRFGRGETIERWLRVRARSFFDWEKTAGVLPPELCDEHKHKEGTPMLLDQATPRNVARALARDQ